MPRHKCAADCGQAQGLIGRPIAVYKHVTVAKFTRVRVVIRSDRLQLRNWRDSDRDAFAALNAAPELTLDLGGPLDRAGSDAKFDRYVAAFGRHGFCRWALEDLGGQFLGYAGVMPSRPTHPLGPHADIGWRLVRSAWGRGYATEAARAALRDAFERAGLKEVLAYTTADNVRSRAVIARLNMQRAAALDYSEPLGDGMWHGLVWIARPG
jgi:RimJ/RimL family protein N-acetyltransferase